MIRFGEFAWGLIQPDEGAFNWQVFDEAFDMAAEEGLKIVLGTPTATPPIWLSEKYPDSLPVNEDGNTITFGGRQHRCYNSPSYIKYTKILVEAMAERYGKRENLFAWQIDNELGAEQKYCHCPMCRAKFQAALKAKYGTVEALNERWLNTFWAQSYQRFDQIETPRDNGAYLPVRPHPSLVYEFLRFSSDSIVEYAHMQYDCIRQFSDAPITTNQDDFSMADNTNWFDMFGKLDIAAFDIYSSKLYEIGFYFDLARSIHNKPSWILEYGTGFNMLNDMLNLAAQKECELVGLFAFHPFVAGQEQGQFGLVDVYGKPSANYSVFRDFAPKPCKAQKKLLFHYDFESSWAYAAAEHHTWEEGFAKRQSKLVYQRYMIHTVYHAAYEAGFGADFPQSLDGYGKNDVLVMPMQIIYKEAFAAELLAFLQRGGRVLTTNDLFLKNEDDAFNYGPTSFHRAIMGDNPEIVADTDAAVLRECHVGEGCVTIISKNAEISDWHAIFKSLQK